MTPTPDQARLAYEWQQQRRKPDTTGAPIEGFSPPPGIGMQVTLWLPPPAKGEASIVYKDGRPVEIAASDNPDPELEAIRQRVLADVQRPSTMIASVGLPFLEYAAAMISANYNVTDEELSALLKPGPWARAVLDHAIGTEQMTDQIAGFDDDVIDQAFANIAHAPEPSDSPATKQPAPSTSTRRPGGIISRIIDALRRRK